MIEYRAKRNSPCKDCEQRHVACHADCEKYKEWQKVLEEEKELFWKVEGPVCAFRSLAAERKVKTIKTNIRKKK